VPCAGMPPPPAPHPTPLATVQVAHVRVHSATHVGSRSLCAIPVLATVLDAPLQWCDENAVWFDDMALLIVMVTHGAWLYGVLWLCRRVGCTLWSSCWR
jgi:hypothetical protein